MRFRDVLADELERRRSRNERYSLRRFARRLGVDHSTISRLLQRPRPIPSRTLVAIGNRSGMPRCDIAQFMVLEDAAAVVLAIRRPAFRPDCRWIATVAGISVDRVNVALQRLLCDGTLQMVSRTRWLLIQEVRR